MYISFSLNRREWCLNVASVEACLKMSDVLKYINKHMTESLRSASTVHLNLIKIDHGVNRSIQQSVEIAR